MKEKNGLLILNYIIIIVLKILKEYFYRVFINVVE
jgi:hypothetical protein